MYLPTPAPLRKKNYDKTPTGEAWMVRTPSDKSMGDDTHCIHTSTKDPNNFDSKEHSL